MLATTLGVRVVPADGAGVRLGEEWVLRFLYFARLLERIRGVEGDVAECGVAGGESLAMFASLVRAEGAQRRVIGLDSWQGLPVPGPEDRAPGSVAEPRLFDWATPATVRDQLRRHGFSDAEIDQRVTLVEGPFHETLPRVEGQLALVHVDADLYDSYLEALRWLWPRLSSGGIVALDEYELSRQWPGPKRAVDEYLATLPAGEATLEEDARTGKWFLVKRLP